MANELFRLLCVLLFAHDSDIYLDVRVGVCRAMQYRCTVKYKVTETVAVLSLRGG